MKRLEQLCHQYTNLSESDIKELQRTARYLSSTTLYQSADVFIDVYKEMSQQALVVYHKSFIISRLRRQLLYIAEMSSGWKLY